MRSWKRCDDAAARHAEARGSASASERGAVVGDENVRGGTPRKKTAGGASRGAFKLGPV